MPHDLYETDILDWSEQQAALLRRVAAGERRNDIDWPHVIEEIADVGSSILKSVRGLQGQAITHLLKIHLVPDDPARDHWLIEIETFLEDAAERFSPSMRQRVDVEAVYRKARARVAKRFPRHSLPHQSPWTLDELLAADADALLAKPTGTP